MYLCASVDVAGLDMRCSLSSGCRMKKPLKTTRFECK